MFAAWLLTEITPGFSWTLEMYCKISMVRWHMIPMVLYSQVSMLNDPDTNTCPRFSSLVQIPKVPLFPILLCCCHVSCPRCYASYSPRLVLLVRSSVPRPFTLLTVICSPGFLYSQGLYVCWFWVSSMFLGLTISGSLLESSRVPGCYTWSLVFSM